jgi:uncharacterized protein YbaR (Trm112 family)
MEILACPKCQGNQIIKSGVLTVNKGIYAKNASTFYNKFGKK